MSILNVLIGSLVIIIGLVVVNLFASRVKVSSGLIRKIAHIGVTMVIIVLSFLLGYKSFIAIGMIVFVAMLIIQAIRPVKTIAHNSIASVGEIVYPLGVAVAAFIAKDSDSFVSTMLILGLADTAAYIIGKNIHSKKLLFSKTLAGSTACFLVAFIILAFQVNPLLALGGGLLVAIAEMFSPHGTDNATIPLVVSLYLFLVA